MAGLYLHIPFCRSRCIYCSFYSQTDRSLQQAYTDALVQSVVQTAREMASWHETVETIYIGGGTPSLMSEDNLTVLVAALQKNFPELPQVREFTIEVNPEDVTSEKVSLWRSLGIDRVSMGIQSFSEPVLQFLRRPHSVQKALSSLELLRNGGFDNVSIDLIFALPGISLEAWQENVEQALRSGATHVSCYGLQYELGTALYRMREKQLIQEISEEEYVLQYSYLLDRMQDLGWEHYEISNFSRPGYRALHNSSYWTHQPYWGVGASAHSFYGRRRWSHLSDIRSFIERVQSGQSTIDFEEKLQEVDWFNEIVMLGLRCKEGVSLAQLRKECPSIYTSDWEKKVVSLQENGLLMAENGQIRLSRQGLFMGDSVISSLFV